jgi:hypothetical protein
VAVDATLRKIVDFPSPAVIARRETGVLLGALWRQANPPLRNAAEGNHPKGGGGGDLPRADSMKGRTLEPSPRLAPSAFEQSSVDMTGLCAAYEFASENDRDWSVYR